MTMQYIKNHDGRRWWERKGGLPSLGQRNSYLVGVTSQLKSGEDWSWPRKRGREEGGGTQDTQRPGSDGTFRNPWEVVFLKAELTPCLILYDSGFSWMQVTFLEP